MTLRYLILNFGLFSARNNRRSPITDRLELTLERPNTCEHDQSDWEKNASFGKNIFFCFSWLKVSQSSLKLLQTLPVFLSIMFTFKTKCYTPNTLDHREVLVLYSSLIFNQFYSICILIKITKVKAIKGTTNWAKTSHQ